MTPLTAHFLTVCLASLAAALIGWYAPPTPERLQLRECSVLLCGAVLGLTMHRDWISGLSLATLLPGVYCAFSGWQNLEKAPKQACAAAFLGASWFLIQTTQRWDYLWLGAALGIGGPLFAVWATQRTNRTVGLALVGLATIFQLTRIPILLAG